MKKNRSGTTRGPKQRPFEAIPRPNSIMTHHRCTKMGLISLFYISEIHNIRTKIRLFSKTKKIGWFEDIGITKPPSTSMPILNVFRT